ncbi:MAG: hypothetical protein HZC49_04040 [Nitrospirae bacterium]|nr:hypothetical protein [Nitrospirota bacterium]
MNSKEYDPASVQKKLEDLDSEVNTFIQVVKEVKEIKASAGMLQKRLMQHEGEIEHKKNELEQLISTTQSLRMNIEEQSKGVIYDLEMMTDTLIREVKSGISQIGNIYEKGSTQLQEQHNETSESLSLKCDEIKKAYEKLKIIVDSHEQRINNLNNSGTGPVNVYDKMEASLNELKKTVNELQKRPYESDNKLIRMEEKLELLINEKYSKQKNFTLVVLIILIAAIFLSLITFYIS